MTHYEDRCTVKGCPEPNSEEWHHCFVCGKPAVDHHHYPSRAQAGKGAKVVAVLCRYHHERITLHEWREGVYDHPNGSKRYYVQNQKGETMCDVVIEGAPEALPTAPPGPDRPTQPGGILPAADEDVTTATAPATAAFVDYEPTLPAVKEETIPVLGRAAPPPILELDLSVASDEDLAALFAEADRRQAEDFLAKCKIAYTYRERHVQAWGSSWIESAYELFHVSRRTLGAYANIHEICDTSDAYLIEQIAPLTDSRSLMQHIGRKKVPDGKVALEAAVAHLAEFGEAPTVKQLIGRLGEEAKPPEVCPDSPTKLHEYVCRYCGKEA